MPDEPLPRTVPPPQHRAVSPRGQQPAPQHPRAPKGSGDGFTIERVLRWALAIGVLAAAGWLLWYFAALVTYLVVGGIIAYLLRPVVDRIQALGLRRTPAILLSFVAIGGVIAILANSLIPFVAGQVRELSQLISIDAIANAAAYTENWLQRVSPIHLEDGVVVRNVRQALSNLVQGDLIEGNQVAQTVSSVVALLTNIVYAAIIIPFITFFLLKDGAQIRQYMLGMIPNRYFEITLAILDKVEENIGRYFRALFLQATLIAILASSFLAIIGLQNPVAIGIFTGLANTIPYFGPFMGFVGGTIVGIAQTGNFALVPGVAVAMLLTQLADNVLLQPIIFSRAAQAHPLVILFVVLIGAQLAGIVGMLVAIPLATTVRVVVQQVLWSVRNYRVLS
ncbi:AI-2E family transporter [Salisaeta longa]|uniref:AI-2E family transporter n=1 Tax=Salisaeta longa TaxID=503170 RepID=UPI0003B71698|nr:AI-2E family transporter [Salisaeta longa]